MLTRDARRWKPGDPGFVPRIDHIAVVVPARDEETLIVACLDSVDRARSALPPSVGCSVVVVADRCTDLTVTRALATARHDLGDIVVDSDAGTVGASRQLGTQLALVDREHASSRTWIANTDADTTVPGDWLTTQLAVAHGGAVGVAGVVELHKDEWCNLALIEAFDRSYPSGNGVAHPHVHGANLGFRADAFRAAGGWNPLATGEDHDLWERLRDHGPVVSMTALTVSTSARTTGRAPSGFAADMAALATEIEPVA